MGTEKRGVRELRRLYDQKNHIRTISRFQLKDSVQSTSSFDSTHSQPPQTKFKWIRDSSSSRRKMSPLPFSDLTNEIVDLTMDTSAAMRETGDTWTMFMGVVVTLLPKIIPMMMPVIMGGDDGIKERFGEDDYNEKIEAMFRNKMLDNLEVIEGFIRAWKNDNLSFDDFGLNANFIQSKSDDLLSESR